MKIGRLLLRTIVGGLFVGHGTQKLFGWFDGHGLDATAGGFESMGIHPGKPQAVAAGASEAAGGVALIAGYHTPLAASAVVGTMLTAIHKVHGKNGPWASKGGYEYNLVLAAAAVAIAEAGPGPISLDALRGKEKSGLFWGLFALAAGAVGAVGVDRISSAKAPAAVHSEPEPPVPAAAPAPAAPEPPMAEAETIVADEPAVDEASVTDAEVATDSDTTTDEA